jgi:hypothetical protein
MKTSTTPEHRIQRTAVTFCFKKHEDELSLPEESIARGFSS